MRRPLNDGCRNGYTLLCGKFLRMPDVTRGILLQIRQVLTLLLIDEYMAFYEFSKSFRVHNIESMETSLRALCKHDGINQCTYGPLRTVQINQYV